MIKILTKAGACFLLLIALCQPSLAKQPSSTKNFVGVCSQATYHGNRAIGSCVVVGKKHILTCAHVLSGPTLDVSLSDGSFTATLVVVDLHRDWALLELDKETESPAVRMSEDKPEAGDWFWGYGFGGKYFGVTAMNHDGKTLRGRIVSGDSGGPIINKDGRLVGLISSYVKNSGEEAAGIDPRCWGNNLGDLKGFVDQYIDQANKYLVHH